jgi:hypothetical protein
MIIWSSSSVDSTSKTPITRRWLETLIERDDLTCLHRSEGGFCLLFPDLPELI